MFWSTTLARLGSAPPNMPPFWLKGGQLAHPLGTENSGRDMLALIIVGAPAALEISVIVGLISIGIGVILGFTAGYIGGWVDYVVRLLSDSVLTDDVVRWKAGGGRREVFRLPSSASRLGVDGRRTAGG